MSNETLEQLANRDYEWGFTTDIEMDIVEPGLSEDVVRFISAKKAEPAVDTRHWEEEIDELVFDL